MGEGIFRKGWRNIRAEKRPLWKWLALYSVVAALSWATFKAGGSIVDAVAVFFFFTALDLAAQATKSKTDRILGLLFAASIGIYIIFCVYDDFIKTIKISIGLCIINASTFDLLAEFGISIPKMIDKIKKLWSKFKTYAGRNNL